MSRNKFYWIKFKTDFFDQEAIDFLLSQNNGCKYIILYQMLCLQAANNKGKFSIESAEKLARDIKHFDFDNMMIALVLFEKLGLIHQDDNNVFSISNYNSMIGR